MKNPRLLAALVALATLASTLVSNVDAGELSPVQSTARPFGIDVAALVQKAASDDRSADFQNNYLPYFLELIDQKLKESADFTGRDGFRLDVKKLFLRTESDHPIRIYFVHEGAGYHNTLGYSMTPAGSKTPGDPYLIFPDVSFHSTHSNRRTRNSPLVVGDFVEIGTGGPGIQMDFFCIADGAKRPIATWHNNEDLNQDGMQHVVAFLYPDSPFVLIGFEDLWGGGDLDYNDCLFVVDIGEINAANLFDVEATLPF